MERRRDGGLLPRPRGEGARPGPSLGTRRAGARRPDRRGFGRDGIAGASEPARGLRSSRFTRRALRRRRYGSDPSRRRCGDPDGGALRADRSGAIRPRRAAGPDPEGRKRGLQCRHGRPARPDCRCRPRSLSRAPRRAGGRPDRDVGRAPPFSRSSSPGRSPHPSRRTSCRTSAGRSCRKTGSRPSRSERGRPSSTPSPG